MSMHPAADVYTVLAFLQWEGDWELIHGQSLAMVPSPSFDHLLASAAVLRQLDEALDACPDCQALFDIDVEFAQNTIVRPDVLVICCQTENERLTRAPDLIFEVISPKTARRDELGKFGLYRTEGVRHYALVYPKGRKAKVWRLVEGEYRKVGDFPGETHCFELSRCAFYVHFSRLWKRKGGQA